MISRLQYHGIKGLNYIKKIMPDKAGMGYVVYSGIREHDGDAFRVINYENTRIIVE